ncbi:tetratricopeptide repeat protein [Myxococcus landrumensis]|uniref:Tetratricopeptide repeat protein n=1 Tax=Myxococcus landrumensis TaxID=2813577 RepID=A0ABX7NC69_9BACT|nr:hypothetical protein [Myxococcus landrumus]QSQ16248.1 hypothetical protein JY572_09455 [Myxococcus landrumus]
MTALSVTSGLAWAGPKLSGSYVGDTYGQVELHMEGDRLVGTSAGSGGGCKFPAGTEVLSGEFQGNVLVATLQVCLSGVPECVGARSFPTLATYNPQSGVLSARVRLPKGCHSPGLKDFVLFLRSTGGSGESEDDAAKDGALGGRGAAPAVADEEDPAEPKGSETRAAPSGPGPVDQGLLFLAGKSPNKWEFARGRFEAALGANPQDIDALVGMAAIHLGLGYPSKAQEALSRIRPVPSSRPDVYAWQAYVADQQGDGGGVQRLLRKALELNWSPENPKPWEEALVKALAGDIELAQKQMKNRKRAPGREAAGAGSPSP